ncbi:MAG: hydrogenase maturation nickel metallochaperone HypA [Flavobacteriaceae bacterium]|nr:hydrogenase maturation nickel metallochaperone HypA [Flavobacteriaceae bacterium]
MHELSIAMGIVRIASEEANRASASRITKIELEIGSLSGVALDALHYVWPAAVRNTVLDRAVLKIDRVEAMGRCIDCDTEFVMQQIYDCCPQCKSNLKGILKGKELRVKALEVE